MLLGEKEGSDQPDGAAKGRRTGREAQEGAPGRARGRCLAGAGAITKRHALAVLCTFVLHICMPGVGSRIAHCVVCRL